MSTARVLRGAVVLVTILCLTAYAAAGVATHVTIDNDSFALVDSFRSILAGAYHPSRTSGFPLYEFVGALVYSSAGVPGVMVLSLALTLGGLIALLRPTGALRRPRGTVAWVALALTPTVMTNASAVMETALLLFLCGVLAWLLSSPSRSGLALPVLIGIISVCLVATRVDASLLVAATALGLGVWQGARGWKAASQWALPPITGAFVGLAIVWMATARFPLSGDALLEQELVRRVLRGAIGAWTAFGPIGAMALVGTFVGLLAVLFIRRRSLLAEPVEPPASSDSFLVPWLLAVLALYGLRFLALADEVEYLLPVLVALAVAAPAFFATQRVVGVMTYIVLISGAATGVVSVSLLDRMSPWDPDPSLRPSIQSGGWVQDLSTRQAAATRRSSEYEEFLKESLGPLWPRVADGTAALMPRNSWNYVLNPGYADYYRDVKQVVGCDELSTEVLIPGWRVSQPPGEFGDTDALTSGQLMRCEVVAELGADFVTPVNSGLEIGARTEYPR